MVDVAANAEEIRPLERVERALEAPPIGVDADRRDVPRPARPEAPGAATAPVVEASVAAVTQKSPLREDIEDALADGLDAAYAGLTPPQQAKFRDQGEALAARFEAMLSRDAIRLRTAHDATIAWLNLLPSQGRFFSYFLVQEAKVKMDAMLALAKRS